MDNFEVCAFRKFVDWREYKDADDYKYCGTKKEAIEAALDFSRKMNGSTEYFYEIVMTFPRIGNEYRYKEPIEQGVFCNINGLTHHELIEEARRAPD